MTEPAEIRKENAMVLELCRASDEERRRRLPGDKLVPHPRWTITHAITIKAPPQTVWPWVIQMGAGRAGWYAYDHIDNGGVPSARRIVPELQHVAVGDVMPALPGAKDAFIVSEVVTERALVLVVPLQPDTAGSAAASDPSVPVARVNWAIVLEPVGQSHTRLITRNRVSRDMFAPSATGPVSTGRRFFIERVYGLMAKMPWAILVPFAGLGHYLMASRMLRGIKRRAEASVACTDGGRQIPLIERVRTRIEHEVDTRSVRFAASLIRLTKGRVARPWRRRVLLLTTRGRKSGKERTVPLQYFPDGEGDMLVVAANSGLPSHPGWYFNLTADPWARVEVGDRTLRVRAEELSVDEADAFWPRVLRIAPDYDRYPRRTSRRIPLIRLVPATPTDPVTASSPSVEASRKASPRPTEIAPGVYRLRTGRGITESNVYFVRSASRSSGMDRESTPGRRN